MFSAPAIVASCCVSGYTSWFVYALFSSKAQFKTFSLCSIMKSLITFQYREALIISCAKSSMIVSGEITRVRFSHDGSADDKENETDSHIFTAKASPCLSYA